MSADLPKDADFLTPILTALADGEERSSHAVKDTVSTLMGLSQEQREMRFVKSGARIVDTRAQSALACLRRAEAIEGGYGVARITDTGRALLAEHPDGLTEADLREIPAYREYAPTASSGASPSVTDSDEGVAVQRTAADEERPHWFVGALYPEVEGGAKHDHADEFVEQGVWRLNPRARRQALRDLVAEMRIGDPIAIKHVKFRRGGVPFETHGHTVSIMDIKATGYITAIDLDHHTVTVDWQQDFRTDPRPWYLYVYQSTVWKVLVSDDERKAELVDFAFHGKPQDIDALRNSPYWAERFGDSASPGVAERTIDERAVEGRDDIPTYSVDSIGQEGCFLEPERLRKILTTLRQKKNLILQGPPGTGKTWLAKRLAKALIGRGDAATITSVQFHPTVSYEDFVRGWRPSGDGPLKLVDGTLLEIAERAAATPDTDHVLVIEEINRGNLAQIFGEMLTLLEADKRSADHAMRLTYRREKEKPFHLPGNLYLIGTMNLADRSLAMVDFALRRRFGFADLQPAYNDSWLQWVTERLTEGTEADVRRLRDAVVALNQEITAAPGLGEQYQIGHSFFTPPKGERSLKLRSWAVTVIEQEIRPLLTEYWYDQPDRVHAATQNLLAALPPARS